MGYKGMVRYSVCSANYCYCEVRPGTTGAYEYDLNAASVLHVIFLNKSHRIRKEHCQKPNTRMLGIPEDSFKTWYTTNLTN